jgi:DNA-directed RNA polymerase specialized sigma24 family protein
VILSLDELKAFGVECALHAISAKKAEDVLLSHEEAARQLGITSNALHKRVHRVLIAPERKHSR